MANKKYKLTISLLASNRKDTLPKTLESLKPILDNVSSELIVVDTGCDEELVEVIKQYTDKVYRFQWCKDFSKARNVGIDKAQGDWFMFIDDDEWFEDVREIVEFFNSGEEKKYNFGKYIVRNYDNMEGTSWTDSIAGRMFRLFEGTRFVDAVHERVVNVIAPVKNFSSYAHHYGYVYRTAEDKRKHVMRNTNLLLEQIKQQPQWARHYCHLTQEYNTIKEYEKSLEYALAGIENADMSISDNRKDVAGLYGNVVWVLLNQLKYEETIEKSEEYMNNKYMTDLGRLALYGFCATACYKLKRYEDCISYAEKFFKTNEMFVKDSNLAYKQDAILIMISLTEENLDRIAGIAFVASVMLGDIDTQLRYIKLRGKCPSPLIDVQATMTKIADDMGTTAEYEKSATVIKMIMPLSEYFGVILQRIEEIKDEKIEAFLNIADVFALIDSPHGYIQFLKIISKRDGDIDELTKLYKKAINDIDDIVNLHHHFWTIAASRRVPVHDMVNEKPMNRWMVTVDDWAKDVKIKDLVEKKQDLSNVLYQDGMHMMYFDVVLAENMLYRKRLEEIALQDIKQEMVRYTNTVMNFYRMIYKDDIFISCPTILPNRCQVALSFMKVVCGDVEDVAGELRKVIKLMPGFKNLVEKYMELMRV